MRIELEKTRCDRETGVFVQTYKIVIDAASYAEVSSLLQLVANHLDEESNKEE